MSTEEILAAFPDLEPEDITEKLVAFLGLSSLCTTIAVATAH
jgi:hypothetical protein